MAKEAGEKQIQVPFEERALSNEKTVYDRISQSKVQNRKSLAKQIEWRIGNGEDAFCGLKQCYRSGNAEEIPSNGFLSSNFQDQWANAKCESPNQS